MLTRSSNHSDELNDAGYTTFEGIVVFTTIAVLVGVIAFIVLADKQIADARNSQRSNDVNTLLEATYQYAIAHDGNFPVSIPIHEREICRSGNTDCTGLIDLDVLVEQKFLSKIPSDPSKATLNSSGYTIARTPGNRITVSAPHTEWGKVISESL
jgi:hypothetical protein